MSLGFLYYKLWTHLVQYEHTILVFLFQTWSKYFMLNWIYYWLKVNLNQVTFWIRRKLKVHQTFRDVRDFRPMWSQCEAHLRSISPFHIWKYQKTTGFLIFSDVKRGHWPHVFRGIKKGTLAWNGLIYVPSNSYFLKHLILANNTPIFP